MCLRRLLFGGVALLLAAGLVAAWFLPPWLDWSRYRDSIATLASDRLGREVRIAGPISLRLLPEPVLTADGVSLADAGDGIAIRAPQLRLRVALGALAAGRIDAQELVLRGAEMRVPWPFQPVRIAAAAPTWFAAASVRIEDGRLSIGSLSVADVQATLTTDVWTGSYAAAGTAQFSARPWHFTARLTRAGHDGSAGLDLALDGHGAVQGVGATLTGQIRGDGTFGGRMMARGSDLSQVLPAPAVPFSAAARISVAGGAVSADELVGEIGGSPVSGAVVAHLPPALRLDVALAAGRLNLDSWLPVFLRAGALPFPAGVDLSAEAAQLAGGTLRRVRGAFDIGGGRVAVREFRAVLPGEAALNASGQVQRHGADGQARFEGDVKLAAPALRTTLAWLESAGVLPGGMLPEGVLRNADLAAHAVLEPGRLALTGLAGGIDASRLSGSLGLRAGKQPALSAVLQIDRLELDPLLPASWPALSAIPSRLSRFDADLRLVARQVVLRGARYGPLSVDAAFEAGRMQLHRVELVGDGLRLAASGTLGEAGRITDGRLDVQAPSATALVGMLVPGLALVPGIGPFWRSPQFWRSPLTVSVQAAGMPEALAVRVAGDLGDLRLEAQPVIDLGARRAAGALTLRHPGASRLAESLGLRSAPAWLGDGSLGLVAQLAVQLPASAAGRIAADSFDLSAGNLHANGALALDGVGGTATPALSGRIMADTLPVPLPSPRAREPLPFGLLAGWRAQVKLEAAHVLVGGLAELRQASATLALADGKLRIEGLSARLGDGQLSGSASVDGGADPPQVGLDAKVSGATLREPLFGEPVDLASGRLDASLSLTVAGYSPAALLSTLGGQIRLNGADGTLTGVSLGSADGTLSDAAVRLALAGGTTAFNRLELALQARRGALQVVEGRMRGPSGSATLSGSVDLAGDTSDLRLGLLPGVADPPEIGLRLTGPLEQLQRVPELAAVALWRAGHVAVPE